MAARGALVGAPHEDRDDD